MTSVIFDVCVRYLPVSTSSTWMTYRRMIPLVSSNDGGCQVSVKPVCVTDCGMIAIGGVDGAAKTM